MNQQLDFQQFAFRWIYCLLVREFSIGNVIRLFDTYLSEEWQIGQFNLYLSVAIILKFANLILSKGFADCMLFFQDLPTKKCSSEDLEILISEAYVFKEIFAQVKFTPENKKDSL
eukprot:TRINITY_DN14201_c0_g1_i1.p3 TRINITY_DN14201_c0_g1~~TRINITY_DN14201_c0_g1_i1.p3  ORF type:complete len:115 (+),score=12.23 TRINITY_DN14201_c0_g1_i1:330-674(+)